LLFGGIILPLSGSGEPVARLEPGTGIEVQLAPDATMRYEIDLTEDSAIDLEFIQESGFADLDLQPASKTLERKLPLMRTEAGVQGHLAVTLLATTSAKWTVTLLTRRNLGAASVALKLSKPHQMTGRDLLRNAASVQYVEAEQLRRTNFRETAIMQRSREIDEQTQRAYLAAERDYAATGDDCGLQRVRIGMARLAVAQGRHSAARTSAEAALATDCEAEAAERAQALKTLGMAAAYQGDFAASVTAAEHALTLYEKTADRRYAGIVLGNLSDVYMQMGATEHALSAARGALAAAYATADHQGVAFGQKSIAAIYLARGELATALREYRGTLDILARTPYPMIEGETWNDLGVLYHRMADYQGSLQAYGTARAVWRRMNNRRGEADTLINRAQTLLELKDIQGAEADLKIALDMTRADGLKSEQTRALRALGSAKLAAGQLSSARSDDRASLSLARESGEIDAESYALRALGDLDFRARQFDAARAQDEGALALARRAADRDSEAVTLAHLARDLAAQGDLAAAKTDIEAAMQIVETERGKIGDPSLRTSYFASNRTYPDVELEILMQLDRRFPERGYAQAALAAAERARARSLQDTFAERAIALTQSVPPGLAAAQRSAEDDLRMAASTLSRAADIKEDERKHLEAAVDSANRNLDAARGEIRSANPRYADLFEPATLDVSALQRDLLTEHDAVLEYWLGPHESYVWIITKERLRALRLPRRTTLERLSAAFSTLLKEPVRTSTGESFEQLAAAQRRRADAVDAAGQQLAAALLGTATLQRLGSRRLAIIADGALAQIPFGVLPLRGQDGLWQSRHEIAYLPSISTLTWLRHPEVDHNRPIRVAVFAAPLLPATAAPLPYARIEADTIAGLLPKDEVLLAIGAHASRAAALAVDWGQVSMVHFATHAIVDRRRPELSGIMLSTDAGAAQDGMLRMNDIYDLHMPADLVVLSGCETAAGPALESEGVISLSRAFFYAGARRVIASLWPVDDRATADFMREFYRALLVEHMPVSAALTQAQQRLARDKRWSANYYWAGWVLQGDWDERNER
jgi:CHAT domain-containing protein